MANTTCAVMVADLETHITRARFAGMKATTDYFMCVWGDDLDALNAVERERLFMVLPERGPMRKATCYEWVQVMVGIRYAVTAEGRARMLSDVAQLSTHIRSANGIDGVTPIITGLKSAIVAEPTYSYRNFEGATVALALLPVTLEYHVAVGG